VRSLSSQRQRGTTGAASLRAHVDWFALSSPSKSSLPRFKPELAREGTEGWKCSLSLSTGCCAGSHSARRKQLSRAPGVASLLEAQLCPELCCPAPQALLAGDVVVKTTLTHLPPLFRETAVQSSCAKALGGTEASRYSVKPQKACNSAASQRGIGS